MAQLHFTNEEAKTGFFSKFLGKILGLGSFEFKRVAIKKEVIGEISRFAMANHPKEFSAFLKGRIKDKTLVIDGIIYQNFKSSNNSSVITANLPLLSGSAGTVHSHPVLNNSPSKADLFFFSKYGAGAVNLIIKKPYRLEDIAAYDGKGRRIGFEIV